MRSLIGGRGAVLVPGGKEPSGSQATIKNVHTNRLIFVLIIKDFMFYKKVEVTHVVNVIAMPVLKAWRAIRVRPDYRIVENTLRMLLSYKKGSGNSLT
jgi:hypothetical protein